MVSLPAVPTVFTAIATEAVLRRATALTAAKKCLSHMILNAR